MDKYNDINNRSFLPSAHMIKALDYNETKAGEHFYENILKEHPELKSKEDAIKYLQNEENDYFGRLKYDSSKDDLSKNQEQKENNKKLKKMFIFHPFRTFRRLHHIEREEGLTIYKENIKKHRLSSFFILPLIYTVIFSLFAIFAICRNDMFDDFSPYFVKGFGYIYLIFLGIMFLYRVFRLILIISSKRLFEITDDMIRISKNGIKDMEFVYKETIKRKATSNNNKYIDYRNIDHHVPVQCKDKLFSQNAEYEISEKYKTKNILE